MFLDFSEPLTQENSLDLGGLIANRVLLNAFECCVHLPPASTEADHLEAYQSYYDPKSMQLGYLVRPFLQWYLFSQMSLPKHKHQAEAEAGWCSTSVATLIRQTYTRLVKRQQLLAGLLTNSNNRIQAEKLILIQHCGLLASKQYAIAGARASGVLAASWVSAGCTAPITPDLEPIIMQAAAAHDLHIKPHRYWQFYLSSALGCTNLIYSLCNTPAQGLSALAAICLCRLQLAAFQQAFTGSLLPADTDKPAFDLDLEIQCVQTILQSAITTYGDTASGAFADGFSQAYKQWSLFDDDLEQQLKWLGSIDQHREIASRIMTIVERNKDNIDLDTFVETLETCSTTHVHDEHRLVVIESGQMVFWGNLEMRLHLSPGEMILVPRNRLHGSSITTDRCIYHQPIIPPAWLAENDISLVT